MKSTAIETERNGGDELETKVRALIEILRPSQTAPDALRPIAKIAKRWELEVQGLRAFIERHGVPTEKVGREVCARESDILRVLDRSGAPKVALAEPASLSPRQEAARRLVSGGRFK